MRCEPPAAMGHPPVWAVPANIRPNEAVSGARRSRMAWAASPANSARARSPSKSPRASAVAGHRARMPKRASVTGWRGGRSRGPSSIAESSSQRATSGAASRRHARPSGPRAEAVDSTDRSRTTAEPSGRGWAAGASGWIHSRPWCARGQRENAGDATPRGWIAEQTSWTNPGRVSSSERVPPPGRRPNARRRPWSPLLRGRWARSRPRRRRTRTEDSLDLPIRE